MHCFVPVLSGSGRKRLSDMWKEETFKDLDCRGQERDGTISCALVSGFSWLGDGDYVGLLPDSGEVSVGKEEVKEVSEISYTFGAKELKYRYL
jgi:hypothetical protein